MKATHEHWEGKVARRRQEAYKFKNSATRRGKKYGVATHIDGLKRLRIPTRLMKGISFLKEIRKY